jgi:hypothetical protein
VILLAGTPPAGMNRASPTALYSAGYADGPVCEWFQTCSLPSIGLASLPEFEGKKKRLEGRTKVKNENGKSRSKCDQVAIAKKCFVLLRDIADSALNSTDEEHIMDIIQALAEDMLERIMFPPPNAVIDLRGLVKDLTLIRKASQDPRIALFEHWTPKGLAATPSGEHKNT